MNVGYRFALLVIVFLLLHLFFLSIFKLSTQFALNPRAFFILLVASAICICKNVPKLSPV